jgi:hypothetical protein
MAFIIKQGDTGPSLAANLVTPSQQPADLSGASVLFHMRNARSTTASVLTAAAVVVDAENGQVRYDWQTGDTDVAGDFEAEFQVTYADNTIETFPNSGYVNISIIEQIA